MAASARPSVPVAAGPHAPAAQTTAAAPARANAGTRRVSDFRNSSTTRRYGTFLGGGTISRASPRVLETLRSGTAIEDKKGRHGRQLGTFRTLRRRSGVVEGAAGGERIFC